jgi:hypothetical protein
MEFLKYTIKWVASNLSIPFWIVGHIHLTMNIYEDIHEILISLGMNLIVGFGFWLEWKEREKKIKSIYNIKTYIIFKKKTLWEHNI